MSAPGRLEIARDRFVADARLLAPGGEDARLTALRREALEIFGEAGLPDTKVEEWRYTNLNALAGLEAGNSDRPRKPRKGGNENMGNEGK